LEDGSLDEESVQAINVAEAYNLNIYIMVGLPYAMLFGVGYFIYRGVRRNEALRRSQVGSDLSFRASK
jgi:hypothetical protein